MPIIIGYTQGEIPADPGSGGGPILPPPDPSLGQGDPVVAVPGSGTSQPRGLEVVFEYNGLRFHDRHVRDCYFVTEIAGLDDSELRDSREANPSDHGET